MLERVEVKRKFFSRHPNLKNSSAINDPHSSANTRPTGGPTCTAERPRQRPAPPVSPPARTRPARTARAARLAQPGHAPALPAGAARAAGERGRSGGCGRNEEQDGSSPKNHLPLASHPRPLGVAPRPSLASLRPFPPSPLASVFRQLVITRI